MRRLRPLCSRSLLRSWEMNLWDSEHTISKCELYLVNTDMARLPKVSLQPKTYVPAKSYGLQTALSGCLPEAASLIHRACTADTCSRDLQQRLAAETCFQMQRLTCKCRGWHSNKDGLSLDSESTAIKSSKKKEASEKSFADSIAGILHGSAPGALRRTGAHGRW